MVKHSVLFEQSPLQLQLGGTLSTINVAYQTYGKLNPQKDNVILLCHALTGDAEPYIHSNHHTIKGWWQDFIGEGFVFDTRKYFIICSNVLGGCSGTTGPSAINPTTGKEYGSQFPMITVQDIVAVQKALLDSLSISRLYAVVGGSFGGLQATQWAISYPDLVPRIINLCAPLSLSPEAIGFNHIMRQAILNDPHFNQGDYYDSTPPDQGLALARMLGMLTYRTHTQFTKAFGRELKKEGKMWGELFQIESYLNYQGQKFLTRFDANSYLRLLRALDLYDPSLGYTNEAVAFARISANYTLIGVTNDQLFKIQDLRNSYQQLKQCGVNVTFHELYSDFGHDAFLVDYAAFADKIQQGLQP